MPRSILGRSLQKKRAILAWLRSRIPPYPRRGVENIPVFFNEHVLSLSPEGTVYGYQVGSVISYFLACHNTRINESGIEDAITRFGYDVISDE